MATPTDKRIRAQEIREFLLSLPIAQHSPMIQYDILTAELSALQKLLNKLKAFVTFLSKLNPSQYLRWMHQAFAARVAINVENDISSDTIEQALPSDAPKKEHPFIATTHTKKINPSI